MWSQIFIGLHVKYPLFLSYFNDPLIFLIDCRNTEVSNFIKMFSGKQVVSCGRTTDRQTDRQTDRMNFIFVFRKFAGASKNLKQEIYALRRKWNLNRLSRRRWTNYIKMCYIQLLWIYAWFGLNWLWLQWFFLFTLIYWWAAIAQSV